MPHTWATYARVTRKIGEKKVPYFVGLPAYLTILTIMITSMCKGFFLPVMTAVNVWQTYHYLRQGYGVARYFGRPEGETDLERKLCFWAYHGVIPLMVLGRWNLIYIVWGGKPSSDMIPVGFPAPLMTACWIVAGFALAAGLYGEYLKYRRATAADGYNCSGLTNLGMYYFMHWYGFLSQAFYNVGFVAVTLFHAFQYLAITWKFEERQKSSDFFLTKLYKMLPPVPLAISYAAFIVGLYVVGNFVQTQIFPLGDKYWPQFTAMCLSAISAHHYFVDTFMWGRKAGL
jgi:hypothetical protein